MVLSIIVFFVYLGWGLLSVVTQGNDRLRKKFHTVDPLGLIPNYRFFCPNPIRVDYHLYFRVRYPDSRVSDWTEVVIGQRSLLAGYLWYPRKRDRKIFYKTVKVLKKGKKKKGYDLTYHALLEWVKKEYADEAQEAIQLRITSKQDLAPQTAEKEIHLSSFHPIHPEYEPALSV